MVDNVVLNQQTAEDIDVLEGLEAVRVNPGMYVGGTDARALHHLVYEVVDNSIDEIMAGRGDHVWTVIHTDGSLSVIDNCGGIPTDIHKKKGISALQLVMTQLHAGAKFNDGRTKLAYKVSGGLHGVGVSAVNALSSHLEAQVRRGGKVWRQIYEAGKPITEVEPIRDMEEGEATGTTIRFQPDMTIMQTGDFHFGTLAQRFREMAYVTRGATLTLIDERDQPFYNEATFYFEGGVRSFVRYMNRSREVVHEVVSGVRDIKYNEGTPNEGMMTVEFGFQYTEGTSSSTELSFANHINTPDGGSHQSGLRMALTRVINNYARKQGLLKEKEANFAGRDTLEGLTAIVSIKHPSPQFESQTKGKLINPEIQSPVSSVVSDVFAEFLEINPREARRIIDKCMNSMRIRDALEKQRELLTGRKNLLENTTLPGKLADCSDRDSSKTEIFIVEGDSAGGCFSSDTEVALTDGRSVSFKTLVEEQTQGKEHFCYTLRKDGTIGVERVLNARITKQNAQVIRVKLDNDQEVICTPDHLFMLRDGSYKSAQALKPDDSLMPLYRKFSNKRETGITIDGYEMTWDPRSETWVFTHTLADRFNRWQGVYSKTEGDHCHHVDFNKLNNNPTNLHRMPSREHIALHRTHIKKTLHRPEVIEKSRQVHKTSEFRKLMSQRMQQPATRALLSAQAQVQWSNPEYKAYMTSKWRHFYETNEQYRQQNNAQLDRAQQSFWSIAENRLVQSERVQAYFAENPDARQTQSEKAKLQWQDQALVEWRREQTSKQWTPEFRESRKAALHTTYYRKTIAVLKQIEIQNGAIDLQAYQDFRKQTRDKSLLRFDTFCNRYFSGDEQKAFEAVSNYNHRIVSIEQIQERIDVYDIEVPNTHNFALASGVFVHNSAKQGRDRHFQAILPLRGKILNTERARLNKILDSTEIKALISALGVGVSDDFNMAKLRYDRTIIMTDADQDGAHIRTLLLTFFFRYMQPLIQEGHLYIAQPPIFRLEYKKQVKYYYPEAGVNENELLNKSLATYTDPQKVLVSRYKGLGEMNPQQLWETTMDPSQRTLLRVTIEDAVEADQVFDMLMGNEVPPRRRFITTHARNARLDV